MNKTNQSHAISYFLERILFLLQRKLFIINILHSSLEVVNKPYETRKTKKKDRITLKTLINNNNKIIIKNNLINNNIIKITFL